MTLAGYERRWRSLIPGWNVLVLSDTCGLSRTITLVCLIVPVTWPIRLNMIGTALAERTRKPWILGLIFGFPPFWYLGVPILALIANESHTLEEEDGTITSALPALPNLSMTE
jgi:hypothetical protein